MKLLKCIDTKLLNEKKTELTTSGCFADGRSAEVQFAKPTFSQHVFYRTDVPPKNIFSRNQNLLKQIFNYI